MISVKFNKKLYKSGAIKSAAKLYKGVADFAFLENDNYVKLTFKHVDKEIKDIIKDEFCNYVLFLMQHKK